MFPKIHSNYAFFGQKPSPNLSFLSAAFFSEVFPGFGGVFLMNDLPKERFY